MVGASIARIRGEAIDALTIEDGASMLALSQSRQEEGNEKASSTAESGAA
jgi:hypothetical protein